MTLRACPCCGLVQRTPAIPKGHVARCPRCAARVAPAGSAKAASRTAALATAALLLFFPGVLLPVLHLERLGHSHATSILGAATSMLRAGEWLVGAAVLACSVVLPPLKLVGLFLVCARPRWMRRRHRAITHRLVEWTGRWGMLDVVLVAVTVASVKLGSLADVEPGVGALAFTGCVLLSLLAAGSFDPHAIWEEPPA